MGRSDSSDFSGEVLGAVMAAIRIATAISNPRKPPGYIHDVVSRIVANAATTITAATMPATWTQPDVLRLPRPRASKRASSAPTSRPWARESVP